MGEIKIRNLPDFVIEKIDIMAKKNGMKRETFLRKHLENLVESEEIFKIEDKYKLILEKALVIIEQNSEEIQKNREVMNLFMIENMISLDEN
ncbi:TPA: hypothetical protein ACKONR_000375 [Clostridioides difficile]|uniref:hypothetical protein n=1 Tax=Clostridioides TaxID=1870884 RepID=UPI00038DB690|nr:MULTISPECIES: hypothetical protein [Clostridioides]MCC0699444.1 hypothetical protein [Clostridioides sp. ZZV15-6383]MCC0784512.1 hypothetical protein [Clostridioides sp. ES-S-0108-01]EGT3815268.1 hypothetical protein [Clostridioides difficile]EGT3953429.1 hypothetical protein [Clostridioides difficile]EGT4202975.1 hypothetical protein [Clostridioides difficile]